MTKLISYSSQLNDRKNKAFAFYSTSVNKDRSRKLCSGNRNMPHKAQTDGL